MTNTQKILILVVLIINSYLLFIIYTYWKADVLYNKSEFEKALSITPNEPIYISKQSLIKSDVEMAKKALNLAPLNQNIRKILISNLVSSNNLEGAEKIILEGIIISPNDPRLYYQLGILQLKIGKNNEAIISLQKSIKLKSNYQDPINILNQLNQPQE